MVNCSDVGYCTVVVKTVVAACWMAPAPTSAKQGMAVNEGWQEAGETAPQGMGERGKREEGKRGGGRRSVCVCVCVLPGPIPTKNTAGIELIGTAERAVTTKSKVLESWTGIGARQS